MVQKQISGLGITYMAFMVTCEYFLFYTECWTHLGKCSQNETMHATISRLTWSIGFWYNEVDSNCSKHAFQIKLASPCYFPLTQVALALRTS